MKRVLAAGAALLLAVTITACGSSSGGTPTGNTPAAISIPPANGGGGSGGGSGDGGSTGPKASPSVITDSQPPSSPPGGITTKPSSGGGGGGVTTSAMPGLSDAEIAEFGADLKGATDSVNAFWANNWFEGYTYEPPSVWYYSNAFPGLYSSISRDEADASDWMEGPTCGGDRALADNAFYCADGSDTLAWDSVFMARAFDLGDSYIYLIIYHEWGHAIQQRLAEQLNRPDLVSAAAELQADCLAGAAVAGAVRDGFLDLESGDEQEIVNSLSDIASLGPWAQRGDHGSALERVQAYTAGYQQGVNSCFPAS
jgi:uncharacterized protein